MVIMITIVLSWAHAFTITTTTISQQHGTHSHSQPTFSERQRRVSKAVPLRATIPDRNRINGQLPEEEEEDDDDEQEEKPNEKGNDTVNAATTTTKDDVWKDEHDGVLSPYHILYPDSPYYSNVQAKSKRQLPLDNCLRLLRLSVERFLEPHNIMDPNEQLVSKLPSVVRIEHVISHKVDPLCWLQAQIRNNNNHGQSQPSLYFETADTSLEAAIYGSTQTYLGTADEEEYWKLVSSLPQSSHLYGGQRFDHESTIGEEWKDFGKGFWVLPAIEVRRNDKNTTTVAIHLQSQSNTSDFTASAKHVLSVLQFVTDDATPAVPPTILPPVLSRASTYGEGLDGQELYERGVTEALTAFQESDTLEKVVLARRMDLTFGRHVAENVNALDILRKWKFASQPGGHIFYIHPGKSGSAEFFGCTPERLFQVKPDGHVVSEALAGTRPRGSSQEADEALGRQLFYSTKDQAENLITGKFILNSFSEMKKRGWINEDPSGGEFSVRRLRHLQHICQRFQCKLSDKTKTINSIQHLLASLHPTPAVGGFPKAEAMEFIRNHETTGFDRGFYSGPVGYVSRDAAEVVVAIRSGLATRKSRFEKPKISVFAGAGIVPGSTVQGEWAETSYKLAVISSIFPQSPITLQSAPTPNVAWATAFIEELIRNGVRQFYICPGSRSTPLVAAIAKAVRSNVGTVHAMSIHDERGAGFRAVGYARGSGHPAAVVTSSGTAVSNLYPAIVEASMDGIPLLVLTADRPYESRDTGANQAIDQVKAFSSSYIRWFRDFLPPSDDVPVSVALADAAHAVSTTRQSRGPVHLNIQFRENLAPDGGPIRNDIRLGSTTKYDGFRFTDSPGFQRWSLGGGQWIKSFSEVGHTAAAAEIGRLIMQSKRGIIVVGNLRKASSASELEDTQSVELLSSFAQSIGFPIFAGIQSGSLRFQSSAVIPFAEHLMRCPTVQENMAPDLVLQFGAPLITTEVPNIIKQTMSDGLLNHVLIHPHHPSERADPEFTVTHKVDSEIGPFIKDVMRFVEVNLGTRQSSQLAPLIHLGRMLQLQMPSIVELATKDAKENDSEQHAMTEPEVILSLSKIVSGSNAPEISLFLSNSMPVRDAEAFLYPLSTKGTKAMQSPASIDVGVNRGASGIDGIIASAAGFADSTDRPTTLLIGDVAALHDINSLHALRTSMTQKEAQSQKKHLLTTIVLNNDGGGIFSFLPIAKHGNDVAFDEFFGTPTNTFSFEKGAAAFDLPFAKVDGSGSFEETYSKAMSSEEPCIIEAVVATRDKNVVVHKEITKRTNNFLATAFSEASADFGDDEVLPLKQYSRAANAKTLVLLHGWMGSKSEWDAVGANLVESLPQDWSIISVDLPGHGKSQLRYSSAQQSISDALGLGDSINGNDVLDLSIDQMAKSILNTLRAHKIEYVDAIAGYSLGGRVGLALKRACMLYQTSEKDNEAAVLDDETKMILLSAYPGEIPDAGDQSESRLQQEIENRLLKDERLSRQILDISNRAVLSEQSSEENSSLWADFLHRWYSAPIWGSLNKSSDRYRKMIKQRTQSLAERGRDLAAVLTQCSPSRHRSDDWRGVIPENTLFLSGELDRKYCSIGRKWSVADPGLTYHEITNSGHALLVEAAGEVSREIHNFLLSPKEPGEQKYRPMQGRDKEQISTAPIFKDGSSSDDLGPIKVNEECGVDSVYQERIGSLDFEAFAIDLVDHSKNKPGVLGIGWGESAKATDSNVLNQRSGFIIQMLSKDGLRTGLGEVSPLSGLHSEVLADAEAQLNQFAKKISELEPDVIPAFDATKVLQMDGGMEDYLGSLAKTLGIETLLSSVRCGLEMALLSLASQVVGRPIHQAMVENAFNEVKGSVVGPMLPLNGLITRGNSPTEISFGVDASNKYTSWKVKVGHKSAEDDAMAISYAFQTSQSSNEERARMVRADANRGFNTTSALDFAKALKEIDGEAFDSLEYVEEPLERLDAVELTGEWSLAKQVEGLENWYNQTSIHYALDESISDLVELYSGDYESVLRDVRKVFPTARGCAAFVLKPSLLGLEFCLRLARVAKQEFGIGAVFTSSFDSGVGLSYAAFLGSLSDSILAKPGAKIYPHGLGTFHMLAEDCLSPSFGSYVNDNGLLNVASLSRAFYGLGLDEIQSLSIRPLPSPELPDPEAAPATTKKPSSVEESSVISDDFEASTATSSSGREMVVVASLPLPFSADIACSRFTDLPQQPRWSPWISSVAYLDASSETEWKLKVRGVNFRWRASSSMLEEPYKGIRWESVSGLKNTGIVEFIPTDEASSLMKVRMVIVTPRILSALFRGTSVFFEDFLRNKILKWSLEMFRDVVKGDLALEEGNIELGDALFGAVEGKANAIEATLSSPMDKE